MKAVIVSVVISIFLVACGSSSDDNITTSTDESTLGSVFVTYTELSEANNNSESTSEIVPYILNLEGIKINGSFESNSVSADAYRFYTGSVYGTVDIHVFIDGVRQAEANSEVSITLNNYINDGYSTLIGNGYFINASVSPAGATDQFYVISISPHFGSDVSSSNYTIEIHHKIWISRFRGYARKLREITAQARP